jgi:hypothetical protein
MMLHNQKFDAVKLLCNVYFFIYVFLIPKTGI